MRRVDAEERRTRLARRHRLTPEARAGDVVDAVRSVVVLHSSDPATVFLSALARTTGFEPARLERALYEERTLVRMLAMRRTLFVVPRELVPVVDAAASRAVAANERRKLAKFVAESGVADDAAGWIDAAEAAALDALAREGRPRRASWRATIRSSPSGSGWGSARDGRPRSALRAASCSSSLRRGGSSGPVPVAAGRRASTAGSRSSGLAHSSQSIRRWRAPGSSACGWRHSARARRRTSAGGRAGRPATRAPPSRRCRTSRSRWRAARATSSRTTSTLSLRATLVLPCSRRSTRPRWAGRNATGIWGRTPRRSSTGTATPARRCGGAGA